MWYNRNIILQVHLKDGQILPKYEIWISDPHLEKTFFSCWPITILFSTLSCWKRCQNSQGITLYHMGNLKKKNVFFLHLTQFDENEEVLRAAKYPKRWLWWSFLCPKGVFGSQSLHRKNLAIFCAEMVRSVTLFSQWKSKNHFYQASILKLVSGLNSGVYVLMYRYWKVQLIHNQPLWYAIEVCQKCFCIITVYQFETCSQI